MVHECDLPPVEEVDVPTREEYDEGMRSLSENRAPWHDNCCPEYLKSGGPALLNWIFVLMTRIWTFESDIPAIDQIGSLIPIPKKLSSTSVDATRPICLFTSIYKVYAILVLRKLRDRVKKYVTWTQAGFSRGRLCAKNLWIIRLVA